MKTLLMLEIKRRVRGAAWWVLLASWIVIIGGISALFILGTHASTFDHGNSVKYAAQTAFSVLLCVQLLMLCIVVPAFSGTVINGDRESGVLAQLQITLLSARVIVVAKWLAAAIVSTVFFLVTSPALLYFIWLGKLPTSYYFVTPLGIIVEVFILAAIGTGLSGIVRRPLFSVLYAYFVIAMLIIGGPTISVVTTLATSRVQPVTVQAMPEGQHACVTTEQKQRVYHWEYYWWLLTTNPVVVVADSLPVSARTENLLTTSLHHGLRSLQVWPAVTALNNNSCGDVAGPSPKGHIPGWPIGLGIHVVLGAGLLYLGARRTRTPIKRMPKGQRIA